jgi:hypothetical protein
MSRMRKTRAPGLLFAVLAAAALAATGCPEKGPAQKAGEKIDETVDKLTHPNEGGMERGGRKLDEQYEKAKEAVKEK